MAWNTTAAILQHAESHPDSLAIAGHDRTITYGRLRFLVAVMACYLRQSGVKPGQVAAVTIALHPLQLICTLALSQIGAVMLPLHMAVPADRRLLAAQRFGADWVISGRDDMRLPGLPFLSVATVNFDGRAIAPDYEVFPTEAETPLRIALSSGTSGDPKGVLLTHGMRARRGQHLAEGMARDARVMTMDLNFTIGYAPTMAALTAGACLVLPHSFAPADLLQTMVRQRVTHVAMSPAQARDIASVVVAEPAPAPQCPSLVNLRIVGGSLTPRLHQDLEHKLTPNVFTGYGATELGSVAIATPDMLREHPNTVGLVRPWVELEIVDRRRTWTSTSSASRTPSARSPSRCATAGAGSSSAPSCATR
jgi:acyl-coenzyme A synthetase/AMP-(fatty) acid ligase